MAAMLVASWATAARDRVGPAHVSVVAGGWQDLVARPGAPGGAPGLSRVALTLARLVPRADVAILVRPGQAPERWWAGWPWTHVAPWLAHATWLVDEDEPVPPRAATTAGFRWVASPLPRERPMHATLGRATRRAAAAISWPGIAVAAAARANAALASVGLAVATLPPVAGLEELALLAGVRAEGLVALRLRPDGRLFVGVAGAEGEAAVIKLGPRWDRRITHEAEVLRALAGRTRSFRVPELLWAGTWRGRPAMVMRAVASARHGARLEEAAAVCLELADGVDGVGPMVHGDLAPWNFLRTHDGLVLVDWERARPGRDPLADLVRFVVADAATRRRSAKRALGALLAPGGPGRRVADALGLDADAAREAVRRQLEAARGPGPEGAVTARLLEALPAAGP
jgi:hypothetical protein